VIPARDEANALPRLLRSLRAQRRPADEVIVVDDHSTDATAQIAGHEGATVLTSAPLPDGWTGKTWACHQGAARASGELLMFVDADVTFAPDALDLLVAQYQRRGGLVSVQPYHRTERPYEQLSAVCNVVALMGTGAFSGPPRRSPRMAFGPCLVVGRADYGLVGGHAAPTVRSTVTEDIGLACQMARQGRPVTVLAGLGAVEFRMYPGGVRQLIEGWTKSLANGLAATSRPRALVVSLWVTAGLLVGARGARAVVGGPRRAARLAAYGTWAAQFAWMSRRVGNFGALNAAAFPVPLAAFVVLCVRSVLRAGLRRPTRWRGRVVPGRLSGPTPPPGLRSTAAAR
jgi:4,4'-diaponeurosporenoate glycosyltransferase